MSACFCDERPPSPLLLEPSNPKPSSIAAESWREAERAACVVVRRIQPTRRSEGRRGDVIEYVQTIIRTRLGSEAFAFGSVPLKTYLPDGDIDLTALGPPNYEENLSVNVRAILEEEEHSDVAPFEVRDVQYIHAEVKLVKCLVQNIIVDISFNQIGGLCTLCFLEQVDNLIGKDHLFKRSIILIKAWCYYESRILGAHHSLISTYALETLVMYIFHLYNSSLDGPIAVLYRFLDYFGKFDWDNFCISLRGPVPISSLPEIVAEMPEVDEGDLLLAPEFLNRCAEMFSVPCRFSENSHRVFVKKYLNIVDPLKANNNLGRSVSKGNLYRIRSAFAYGARKLGQILLLQREHMEEELNKFFKNTLERHGDGERPDVQGNCNSYPDRGSSVINSENGSALPRNILDKQESLISQSHNNIYEESQDHLDEAKRPLPLRENVLGEELHQGSRLQDKYLQPCGHTKRENSEEGKDLSSSCLAGVSTNILATCEKSNSRGNTNANANADAVTFTKINHAPHLFFHQDNGEVTVSSGASEEPPGCPEVHVGIIDDDAETNGQGLTSHGYNVADLSGDHENHIKNLHYSQWCHENFSNGCVSLGKPFSFPSLFNKQQWDAFSQCNIFRNGLVKSSPFSRVLNHYQLNPNLVSASYNVEDLPKPRGTGMYLTNMNYQVYRDTPAPAGGRNLVPAILGPRFRSSGPKNPEAHSADLLGHELVQQAQHKDNDKHSSFEPSHASDLFLKGFPQSKRNTSSEGQLEIGVPGSVLTNTSNLEYGRLYSDDAQGSRVTSPAQHPLESQNNRRPEKLYHLKDEEEFPPLSNRGPRNSIRSACETRK